MNRSLTRVLLVGSIAAMGLGSLAAAAGARPSVRSDAVSTWNANAGDAALAACLAPANNPLHESRLYAAMHLAVHDALNAIDRRSRPYAFATQHPLPGASLEAAVAAAARDVLVPLLEELPEPSRGCVPAAVASVETDYAAALAAITDDPRQAAGDSTRARRRGHDPRRADRRRRGHTAGRHEYPQGDDPGEYRFTPGFDFAFAPGWADVTPFVLRDSSQFRADPPYEVTTRRYAADFAEVKRLGGDAVTTPSDRTAEQTEIARFWVESSPLQWNRIARNVSASSRLDPWAQARLFGLLNMALADGYVGSFETKYLYNYWRPVTAIRQAATDGNPHTSADPTWTPLEPTPPIPDHDSAHSVEGGAAAEVMRRFFGTDRIAFRTCSLTLASRQHLHRPRTGHAQVRQLLRGGRRERTVTHPHRVPLPQRGRGRNRARPQDRRPRRRPVPAPRALTGPQDWASEALAERGLARSPAAWATRRPAAPTSARRQRNVSGPRCTPPP